MFFNDYTIAYLFGNILMTYAIFRFIRVFYSDCKVSGAVEFACYAGYYVIIACIYMLYNIPLVLIIANLTLFFLLTLLYDGELKKAVLTAIIIYPIFLCIEVVFILPKSTAVLNLLLNNEYNSIFGVIVSRIVSFVVVLGAENFKNVKNKNPLPNLYWFCLLAVPSFTIFMLLTILVGDSIPQTMIVICLIAALTINMLVFYLYDSIARLMQDKIEKLLMEKQNMYYERQLQMMTSALDNYKTIRHDLKNKLTPLLSLASDRRNDELQAHLAELTEIYSQRSGYAACGNVAIDSIINFKLMEKPDVRANVEIFIPKDLSVPALDLAVILGNMLDNALEATENVEDRWVDITIKFQIGYLTIEIINSYDGILLEAGGVYLTHKEDRENHGLGLKSIEGVIQKYDGLMQITHDEKQFRAKVLIYVE